MIGIDNRWKDTHGINHSTFLWRGVLWDKVGRKNFSQYVLGILCFIHVLPSQRLLIIWGFLFFEC